MIGIFDSGLGGLTIFKAIEAKLPRYDYLYLGDTARAPYGDHSQEIITQYTKEAVAYLFDQGCVLVLLACNTASAEALRDIQKNWLPAQYPDRNVLGVIRPLSEAAAALRTGVVGVLGTRSTIASHAYRRELASLAPKTTVIEQACRLLVPLIEEGFEGKPEMKMILKKYLRPVKERNVSALILGCTHYGVVAADIKRYMGGRVTVLDSGAIVAEKFAEYLERHPEFRERLSTGGTRKFLTTEPSPALGALAKKFFGRSVAFEQARLG